MPQRRCATLTLATVDVLTGTGIGIRRRAGLCNWVSASARLAALMSVVPLDQVWVDANFRSRSCWHARGQSVTLTAIFMVAASDIMARLPGSVPGRALRSRCCRAERHR